MPNHTLPTDPRDAQLVAAHRLLAHEILNSERQRQALRRPALKNEHPATDYSAWIDLSCFFEVELSVELYAPTRHDPILGQFTGEGGGSMIGDAQLWGSCWLYEPLEAEKSWTLSFSAYCIPSLLTLVWWDEEGPMGSFVGTGPSTGGGLFGGSGKLTCPPAAIV